ncbi:MAG TPA: polyprenol monophosphomannose synthase [Jatrophihabitantaceae bacterium]|jgi:dolichol-phosphate mannosyltransferase
MKILVVVPTYNESDNIERVVARLHTTMPEAHALVVDDASPDGTGKIADAMADADERVQVLHRPAKAGLGAAYVAGFGWGLERGYDVLVEMDADGSHAPEQLPRLIAALGSADVVIGSRWVRGGAVVNWPLRRELLSRGANVYSRLALGIGVHDATGGYRAYRREVLEQIDYQTSASQGYCFQVELALRAVRGGFRIVEVPIMFADRERGESKMSGTVVREALWKVTGWGVQHRAGQVRDLLRRG